MAAKTEASESPHPFTLPPGRILSVTRHLSTLEALWQGRFEVTYLAHRFPLAAADDLLVPLPATLQIELVNVSQAQPETENFYLSHLLKQGRQPVTLNWLLALALEYHSSWWRWWPMAALGTTLETTEQHKGITITTVHHPVVIQTGSRRILDADSYYRPSVIYPFIAKLH